ncbi:strawberry notch family protein [Variovorax sp. LjRoot175]|uniref:strawberry notch C-terminal domain-containing protein n=1 Tax=Variovorax sp. LjRoot175 TaxID=3342276 RepID=UPI003ECF3CB7
MPKWIDLNDASGARLKIATIEVGGDPHLHLFVTGLSYLNPAWNKSIAQLGFHPGGARKYLVRRVKPGERPKPSDFRSVFPNAAVREMTPESYMLNLQTARKPDERPASKEERAAAIDINNAVLLGRNSDGERVFEAAGSRYVIKVTGQGAEIRVDESDASQPHVFLRLPKGGTDEFRTLSMVQCADGFVRSMVLGEVQHSEDQDRFLQALHGTVNGEQAPSFTIEQHDEVHAAIETSLLRYLRDGFEVAQDAYGESARLTDMLPPFRGHLRGTGTMPAPISVASQRLLGDTDGLTVVVPNAFDGASFAFLPEGTNVRAYRGTKDMSALSSVVNLRASTEWQEGEFSPGREVGADAMFINADPVLGADGRRTDYMLAINSLRSLKEGGRAVIVLAADAVPGELSVASRTFLQMVNERYQIQSAFETAPILSRKAGVPENNPGLRILSVVNRRVDLPAPITNLPVISSWDDLKSAVDEAMARAEVLDAQAQGVDVERAALEGRVQRPYIAFSRVGEARTMVPSNMQAPLQATMTRIESLYGQVDELVTRELGWGENALAKRLSPEQVDGISMMIVRQLEGYASILADETGIGKGRQLAAMMAWALRRNQPVFFVTDKANLFSDLARDLKAIGEWDRVRPMVMNTDGEITWEPGPGEQPVVLAEGFAAARTKAMVDGGMKLEEAGLNTCFLTYSQIAGAESDKAQWVKNQLGNALIIFDEAHVAAGSDSQIASHISEMARLAKGVQYASATWSKTEDNLHIYQRALPDSVNVASLAAAIKKGGESFSEVLSSMLAAEGALIRREHDLSKLDVSVYTVEERRAHNERVSDAVAEALGAATYLAGDMSQIFMRGNREAVSVLRKAKEARSAMVDQTNAAAQTPVARANIMSSSFGTGSVLYQVMKAVQGALNADQVADRAIEHIRAGLKPVIVSEATNEALTRMLMAQTNAQGEGTVPRTAGGLPSMIKMPTIRDAVRAVLMPRLTTVVQREITEEDIPDEPEEGALALTDAAALAAAAMNAEGEEGEAAPTAEMAAAQRESRLLRTLQRQADGEAAAPDDADAVNLDEAIAAAAPEVEEASARSKKVISARRTVPIMDLPGMTDADRQHFQNGVAELERLINAIPELPVSAFDVIEQKLRDAGITVGEITGRSFSLERLPSAPVQSSTATLADSEPGDRGRMLGPQVGNVANSTVPTYEPGLDNKMWKVVPRLRSKRAVNAVKRAFNNGEIQTLLINRSAATGASMHASPQFLDRSRRVLLEHQIPENVTDRIQLIGRVNRYDQVTFPLVETCTTGIYGELRYVMMQNRKLEKMSANVRSSRENAMLIKDVPDLFNSIGLEAVRSYVQDEPLVAKKLALPDNFLEIPGVAGVNMFLMRLPLLKVAEQRQVYEQLFNRFDESFNRHELLGTNPLKTREYDWRAKEEFSGVFFGDTSGERENMAEALINDALTTAEAGAAQPAPAAADAAPAPTAAATMEVSDLAAGGQQDGSATEQDDLLSAFDRPVYIRKIAFNVDLKPMSWTACVAAASVSGEVLAAEGGHFQLNEEGRASWKPEIVAKLNAGMKAIVSMAAVAAGMTNSEEAVLTNPPAQRAHLRAEWLKDHIEGLVPGGLFVEDAKVDGNGVVIERAKTGVIVNMKLPAEARELILPHKWKIAVVFPGEERPIEYSLRALLSEVRGDVRKGEVAGTLMTNAYSRLRPGQFQRPNETGWRFSSVFGNEPRVGWTRDEFDLAPVGQHRRSGYVLGGNMYMAYDWSVKSRVGRSIIYTDDKGMRQRGVLLPATMSHVGAQFMPMRVWGGQIKPFVKRLVEAQGANGLMLETEFMSSNKPYGILINDKGLLLLTKSKDARRALRLMRGEQVKMRKEALGDRATPARDPLNVTLGVLSRNGRLGTGRAAIGLNGRADIGDEATAASSAGIPQGYVAVKLGFDPTKPALLDRALSLLVHGTGLEIYAKGMQQRALAKEVGREYFAQIRAETAQRRDQVRQAISAAAAGAPVEPVPQPDPADEHAEAEVPAANDEPSAERAAA